MLHPPEGVAHWTIYAASSRELARGYGHGGYTCTFNWRDVPAHFIVGPDEDGIGGSVMGQDLIPPQTQEHGDWWVDYEDAGLGAAMRQCHGIYCSFNIVLTGPADEMAALLRKRACLV